MRASRARLWLARALLSLSAVALLVGVEAVSRAVGPVPVPQPLVVRDDPSWNEKFRSDPLLFWSLRPGLRRPDLVTNRLGLRGAEIPARSDREFRILSLGESSTFGWGVAREQTYSALLEGLLPSVDGRSVRVVNAGVPAYTSFQGWIYLRHRGVALDPDAVLYYFGANDFTPRTFLSTRSATGRAELGLTDREVFERRRRPSVRAGRWALENLNLFRILVRPAPMPGRAGPAAERGSRLTSEDRLEVLSQMWGLCRERGIRLVILVPWYREFGLHVPLLRDFAAAHDLVIVDLPQELAGLPGRREEYFLPGDAIHPDPGGHREIARAVARVLGEAWGDAVRPRP